MSGVYILSEYGKLTKEGEHLNYKNAEGTTRRILTNKIEFLILQSHISITGDTLSFLAEKQIPVYIMGHGNSGITLDYGVGKNGFLRQMQYKMLEGEKSLEVAKAIVYGKIRNEIAFLERLERSKNLDLGKQIRAMKGFQKTVKKCADKQKLRGLEGIAARNYFDLFDLNLNYDWAVFGKRSLAYDLMEEFRTPFGDRLCCSLINKGVVYKERVVSERGVPA